jgi:hypothetical protein
MAEPSILSVPPTGKTIAVSPEVRKDGRLDFGGEAWLGSTLLENATVPTAERPERTTPGFILDRNHDVAELVLENTLNLATMHFTVRLVD